MKRISLLLVLLMAGSALWAVPPSDVEAYMVHQRLYARAEDHLQGGTAEQRLRAAQFLGARRNPRYVRLLGRELLSELAHSAPYHNMPANAPVVKSYIAWALGRIGHTKAVPYLLEALATVGKTIEAEQKAISEARTADAERFRKESETKPNRGVINDDPLRRIIMSKQRPGPYLESKEHALPYSPDVYWSLSNEFRKVMAPDLTTDTVRVRLMGFNWVNTAFYIFDAIGEIYEDTLHKDRIDEKHVDAVAVFLRPPNFAFIRGAAAICLGRIGSPKAVQVLDSAYDAEKDDEVRAKIAHAILRTDRSKTRYYLDILKYLEDSRDHVRYPAAVALRDLKMGESLVALQEAYRLEHVVTLREVIKEAIDGARINSLTLPD